MTNTDRSVAGVIAALLAPDARLNEMNAAFGVVIVCVALATTMEVMITTTAAKSMANGRENFRIRILIAFILFGSFLRFPYNIFRRAQASMKKYWEIIADNLSKAGWSWGCVATVDSDGRIIFVADAHRDDGKRFVVRAEEKLTAFLVLESAIRGGWPLAGAID
jgi:hypothetical protein